MSESGLQPFYEVTWFATTLRKNYHATRYLFRKTGLSERVGGRLVVWTSDLREHMPKMYDWLLQVELGRSHRSKS